MAKPLPSEWGKLNAGQTYGVLAIDLGRAIFGVPWGKYELPLLYRLIEHSWCPARTQGKRKAEADGASWPDPQPCPLNINAIAAELGFPRQRLYEARDRLVAMNVLVEDEAGFWLNKNADEWVEPRTGEPMLGPKMVAYALNGRRRRQQPDKQTSVTPQRDMHVTPQRDIVSRPSVTCTDPDSEPCHGPALHDVTVQRDTMSRSSVTSHIEERAPESIETGKEEAVPCSGDSGEGKHPETIAIPPCPTDDTTMHPPMSGNHNPTREQVEYCWRVIWEHFGETRRDKEILSNGYYERQRFYSPESWLEAFREASRRRKTMIRSIGYIETIAADYDSNGVPERKPMAGQKNAVASPAPRRPEPRPPYLLPIKRKDDEVPQAPKTYARNKTTKTGTTGV